MIIFNAGAILRQITKIDQNKLNREKGKEQPKPKD